MERGLGAVAEGISRGIRDVAMVKGIENQQEEAGMKKTLFQQHVADWEFENRPVTTVNQLVGSIPHLDDAGKSEMLKTAANYGYNPDDKLTRKHLAQLDTLIQNNPNIQETIAGHQGRYLKSQIEAVGKDTPEGKVFQQKLDDLRLTTSKSREIAKVKAEETKAEAARTAASVKEPVKPKDWEQKAIDEGWTAEEIANKKAQIVLAGRPPRDQSGPTKAERWEEEKRKNADAAEGKKTTRQSAVLRTENALIDKRGDVKNWTDDQIRESNNARSKAGLPLIKKVADPVWYNKDRMSYALPEDSYPVDNPGASSVTASPVPGAKQAPDGNWYIKDPKRPGKYLQVQP